MPRARVPRGKRPAPLLSGRAPASPSLIPVPGDHYGTPLIPVGREISHAASRFIGGRSILLTDAGYIIYRDATASS